ncbi:hypothetical protein EVAR_71995_1 [Eumeta japonica]|uniref:Uncharacterized protein n=1 Tax=Eumeta variegata TaxID=151549 RepID=A0A4C1SKD2_EUMVA|nr:hypothetical protein EVAR_71995_1 [Eumeta japonica]
MRLLTPPCLVNYHARVPNCSHTDLAYDRTHWSGRGLSKTPVDLKVTTPGCNATPHRTPLKSSTRDIDIKPQPPRYSPKGLTQTGQEQFVPGAPGSRGTRK